MQYPAAQSAEDGKPHRVGCVSFLNALPLIDGLESDRCAVVRNVPSGLLAMLERGEVDIALCPVADLMLSKSPLNVVPVGGIGCDGPTLTVRLFSKVPFDRVTTLHADTDSHTSVRLARVLLAEMHGITPQVVPMSPAEYDPNSTDAQTLLLIGDKVITSAPDIAAFPHQLDAGEAWKQLTGLPFVFATWLVKPQTSPEPLGALPGRMRHVLEHNLSRLDEIAAEHAPRYDWPRQTALHYMRDLLRYRMGPAQLDAMNHYLHLCTRHGLNPHERRVVLADGFAWDAEASTP